jgi:NAD(P)-dependent dehydrogenase (short-subunit alcohol dehydrogenase family)
MVRAALKRGHKVIATGRNMNKLDELRADGASITQLDVTDESETIKAMEAEAIYSHLDIVVINARSVLLKNSSAFNRMPAYLLNGCSPEVLISLERLGTIQRRRVPDPVQTKCVWPCECDQRLTASVHTSPQRWNDSHYWQSIWLQKARGGSSHHR